LKFQPHKNGAFCPLQSLNDLAKISLRQCQRRQHRRAKIHKLPARYATIFKGVSEVHLV
jgi:hypothetical protein